MNSSKGKGGGNTSGKNKKGQAPKGGKFGKRPKTAAPAGVGGVDVHFTQENFEKLRKALSKRRWDEILGQANIVERS